MTRSIPASRCPEGELKLKVCERDQKKYTYRPSKSAPYVQSLFATHRNSKSPSPKYRSGITLQYKNLDDHDWVCFLERRYFCFPGKYFLCCTSAKQSGGGGGRKWGTFIFERGNSSSGQREVVEEKITSLLRDLYKGSIYISRKD
jgi:hypothetical protein